MTPQDLWQHQKVFVDRARFQPHVAALMEPGTGKTRAAIEALREDYNRHKVVAKTLIICPLSTCKQWEKAIAEYSKIPEAYVKRLTQSGKKRAELLSGGAVRIAITNFEGVRIPKFYEALLSWSPDIVIIDESHKLKDSQSTTAKKIYPLCMGARRRFILTGTPVLNSLLDIFGQYKALDPNLFGGSFWKFRAKYFYDKNAGMPSHVHFPDWRPTPEAAKEIARLMAPSAVHAKKSECLDLPDLVTVRVPVEFSPEQKKLYTQMEEEYVADLQGVQATAEFAMTKSLRLQQILSGFVSDGVNAKHVEANTRLQALRDILESLGKKQVIIWTNFVPTYAKIQDVCSSLSITSTFLTGLQSIAEKEEAIRSFRSGSTQAIISNPAAGGTGVDGLQVAPYAIYYTRSFNLEHYLQSRDRNHRGGSEIHDKITHYHLIADGTVDSAIFDALYEKRKIGDALVAWSQKAKV